MHVFVCMYVCKCACMHVCMYVCILVTLGQRRDKELERGFREGLKEASTIPIEPDVLKLLTSLFKRRYAVGGQSMYSDSATVPRAAPAARYATSFTHQFQNRNFRPAIYVCVCFCVCVFLGVGGCIVL